MFRVQAHVFKTEGDDSGMVGRLTFTGRDYNMAKAVADNVQFDEGHTANVDFDMCVGIGRRRIWVDCNAHCLEAAADVLMSAAHNIRTANKLKAV